MHPLDYRHFAGGALAAFALFSATIARAQATLYGVGDLSGDDKIYSQVRDATKVGGVIYAVGGSSANGSNSLDTAFLWKSNTGITALPNLETNTTATNGVTASAITPDAAYIASRARSVASGDNREAVRVTVSGLSNLALGWLPGSNYGSYSAATAISNDGSVLYGFSSNEAGKLQAVRFTSGPSVTAINAVTEYYDTSIPAFHGTTADGSLMLGTRTNSIVTPIGYPNGPGPGNQAFVYDHGDSGSVSALPFLSGGTWNMGLAINSTGTLALLGGNSTTYTNGALYLTDINGALVTNLGSPNTDWEFSNAGGMSDDGSVVGMLFGSESSQSSFIRNASGWHDFYSIASGAGADLTGWTSLDGLLGISGDGTLVWGWGKHNGFTEGFVIEFSSGYLAAIPEPSAFGAWAGACALLLALCQRRRPCSGAV